jgi:DNA-binding IclR family transcriptional regulator
MASMSQDQRDAWIETLFRDLPAAQQTSVAAGVQQSLRDYDKYGFVFSCGDWSPETFAVGVPLVSADRTRVLALSCSGPVFDMTRKRLTTEIGPRIVQLRDQIYQSVQGFF